MPVLHANGIDISYADTGVGPPVLLIMGSGARGRVWASHQVPALVDAGHRVVTFDNRGIPPTDECADGFVLSDMVSDTAALIEALGIGPCAVVGTSLGATIGSELAAARPDLVDRLVLMAARCRADAMRRALSEAERELHDSGTTLPDSYRGVVEILQNLSPSTAVDEYAVRDWLDILQMPRPPLGAGARIQMDVSDVGDRTAVCAAITAPTLVIAFADDVVNPPHLSREVADAVAGSRYETVRHAGHYGYLERPEEVNELLVEFLK